MDVPFTAREFLRVFTSYNAAIWPMQLVAYALGAAAIVLALRRHRQAGLRGRASTSATRGTLEALPHS